MRSVTSSSIIDVVIATASTVLNYKLIDNLPFLKCNPSLKLVLSSCQKTDQILLFLFLLPHTVQIALLPTTLSQFDRARTNVSTCKHIKKTGYIL